jgi:hypothetical protein
VQGRGPSVEEEQSSPWLGEIVASRFLPAGELLPASRPTD